MTIDSTAAKIGRSMKKWARRMGSISSGWARAVAEVGVDAQGEAYLGAAGLGGAAGREVAAASAPLGTSSPRSGSSRRRCSRPTRWAAGSVRREIHSYFGTGS